MAQINPEYVGDLIKDMESEYGRLLDSSKTTHGVPSQSMRAIANRELAGKISDWIRVLAVFKRVCEDNS
jgi:hypothetical protein